MDTERIKALALAIKERVDAASIWDDGYDSPMQVINSIDDLVIDMLNSLGVTDF